MNFFDHKNLGNHLLQLRPKVVKHPVYAVEQDTQSVLMSEVIQHFVYLVGLHIYYKMIHGPYNIKLK